MIQVEHVTKQFTRNDRDFDAVHDVSLEVKRESSRPLQATPEAERPRCSI